MCEHEEWIVPDACDGERLDKVLAALLPDTGLRLRRRLCEDGRTRVDGRVRKPGFKVAAGQRIALQREEEIVSPDELGLMVVGRTDVFAAVYKPGRVHSAALAGGGEFSAEEALPALFPDVSPVLLNRLDFLTSGLLLVALDPSGARIWAEAEASGAIRKFYVAEVQGRFDGVVTVRNRLDTDDRRITRVLDAPDEDLRRWTDVQVLAHDRERGCTRVACLITKGARHQIRAHLAAIGHPILGDPLYGDGREGDFLHLHHRRIELPGFTAEVSPPF